MENEYWPLFELRLRTPRLEIRLPNDETLVALARLAALGVHDPSTMPFLFPWTDEPSPQLERGMLQWGWRHRAEWTPDNWSFTGAVFRDGVVIGVQSLSATDFATRREVNSGSWLGRAHQGQGVGKEMRAAILTLAFEGLGAEVAHSGGFTDNETSLNVSRSFGYKDDGRRMVERRGVPAELLKLRLDRADWLRHDHVEAQISGLDACRDFFIAPHDS
jgi:RimJ/RimL family protein N-acetyltransferase